MRNPELRDMTEADYQNRSHQGLVIEQLKVHILLTSATLMASYMGVFVVKPLEPATIVESLDILREIVLEHIDLLSEVHRQLVKDEIEIELVLLKTITQ